MGTIPGYRLRYWGILSPPGLAPGLCGTNQLDLIKFGLLHVICAGFNFRMVISLVSNDAISSLRNLVVSLVVSQYTPLLGEGEGNCISEKKAAYGAMTCSLTISRGELV